MSDEKLKWQSMVRGLRSFAERADVSGHVGILDRVNEILSGGDCYRKATASTRF